MVSVVYFYSQQQLILFSIIGKNVYGSGSKTATWILNSPSPMDTLQQYAKTISSGLNLLGGRPLLRQRAENHTDK